MTLAMAALNPPAPGAGPAPSPKTRSSFYAARTRTNAAANAAKHDWARKQVEEAEAAARPWVETPDDELWNLIFSPQLKRAIAVNVDVGCPKCGQGIYGSRGSNLYAWLAWVPGHRWKVQCPNCKDLFPKNDFEAFYRSGISPEDGLFHAERADRRRLFNPEYPDPKDPLHTWGVDDGSGWQRFLGGPEKRDWYIAYHTYFGLNGQITHAMRSLAVAYSLTGKPIYAHKCTILLDRLADVYPGYNGKDGQFFNNVWKGYSDGIIGPNYWDGGAWAQRAIDYDMIYDGIGALPETVAFIRGKARLYKVPRRKESIEDIRENIEQRILVDMGRHHERIWMNGTETEMAQATVDLVLRGDAAMDDFVKTWMPALVPPQHLNNDGSGNERSTGYDSGAFGGYCSLVEQVARMDRGVARAALEGYPKLRAAFDFWPDIWCVEKFIPNIGDVGEPGSTSGPRGTAGAYLTLFDLTGNPRYAQVAVRIAGGDAAKLPRNIYGEDPEALITRAVEADRRAGPWHTPSVVKPDYKLGILRSGAGEHAKALWLFYSPDRGTSSHSHFDALTCGLFAYGVEMICEQGYPLYTGDWPARWAWTSHTRSHATVTVDGQCQTQCPGGKLLGFAEGDGVRMMAAEARCAYPNVSRYRRTLVMVDVSPENSFILDVFRVRGGTQHEYTVPVFYADCTTSTLDSSPHPDLYEGYIEKVRSAPLAAPSPASEATQGWWVDYAIRTAFQGELAAHLRIHGRTGDATLLLGEGQTRLGRDKPQRLPYLILQRRTNGPGDLDSTFVVLYEPYRGRPFLPGNALSATADERYVHARITVGTARAYALTIEDNGAEAVNVRAQFGEGVPERILLGTQPSSTQQR